jgi:hypothetical protein
VILFPSLHPTANQKHSELSPRRSAGHHNEQTKREGRVAGPNNFLEFYALGCSIALVVIAAEAKARYSVVQVSCP